MDMKTRTVNPNKTETHRLQVVAAIAKMDATDVDFDHMTENVERLRMELQAAERELMEAKLEADAAIDAYWALETMTNEEFADNLDKAEIYAKVSGSIGCTYNGVKWER